MRTQFFLSLNLGPPPADYQTWDYGADPLGLGRVGFRAETCRDLTEGQAVIPNFMDPIFATGSVTADTQSPPAARGSKEAHSCAQGARPGDISAHAPVMAPELSQSTPASFLETSRAAVETINLEEALRIIAWRGAEALQVQGCIVYEYKPSMECIIPRAIFERSASGLEKLGVPVPLSECPMKKTALETGEPVLERISGSDLHPVSHPVSRDCPQKWGKKTCLTIPLLFGSERKGLFEFYDTETERDFDEAELAVVRGLGSLASQAIHTAQLLRQMNERNRRLASLVRANRAISSSLDLDEVLEAVANQAMAALECDACSIYQTAQGENERVPGAVEAFDGLRVLQEHLEDPDLHEAVRADLTARGEKSRLIIPLPFGRSRLGTMVISQTASDRPFTDADVDFARGLAEQAGMAINNARQFRDLRDVHAAALRALIGALGAKEPYTQGHAARVAQYLVLLGLKLGWPDDMVKRAEEAAYLHDIGKLAVSDTILLKPGPLSEREWTVMRAHPETSEEILRPMIQAELADAIRHHHEKYDGSGYPDGLKGEDIPLLARAMCVADAYDAMSFQRPYRRPLWQTECRAELRRSCGSHFDPTMVDAFLTVLDDMNQQRKTCLAVAEKVSALIDGDKHKKLRRREDEAREEYREIVGILRDELKANQRILFLTTQSREGSKYFAVVDAKEDGKEKSHVGDELLIMHEETQHVYAGETPDVNVLYADERGVSITASAPLRDSTGEIVGLICAGSSVRQALSANAFDTSSGSMASLLGEAKKRIARAEFEATTDGLTGVFNHRYLHEYLADEISRAMIHQSQFAVLFIDIDLFIAFNDVWGHSSGDAALRAVAHIIEGQIRRGDIVARYGGEEFVAVLSDTDLEGGLHVAERVRQKVGQSPLVVGTAPITVSIGVSVFPSHAVSRTELIQTADSAMYAAKRFGRNRVQAYFAAPLLFHQSETLERATNGRGSQPRENPPGASRR